MKRRRLARNECVYCQKPIEKGQGVVIYPHPNWQTVGHWLNATAHRRCDNEYKRHSQSP